ncbi:MAG: translation initiation factor 2 [Lachnospiraceae bacterium]|nr:translation initiation factor 2 [Lachnospiraceae bacterium]
MVGSYHIIIQNSIVKYEFDINRNITVIKGDSATGKTVLVDMIREFVLNGSDSGITLSSSIPCRVVEGSTWEEQLSLITGSIVFIDEGNRFVSSHDFARKVREGKNYYVIVTRERLNNLPYSVTEIYGIHSSGKYENLVPVYHEMYRIYDSELKDKSINLYEYCSEMIIEDTNSGYEFFASLTNENIKCISANGKDNIFNMISNQRLEEQILIIADGAAFGCEMERVYDIVRKCNNMHLYLPESFEWIILKSGIIRDKLINEILEKTEDFADSEEFFSWERFYTYKLIELTKDTYLAYNKSKLNDNYKHKGIMSSILQSIEGINFREEE